MGGGDLNLKKSWAVNLLKNQKAVWDAEQGALKERKKIEQVRRERQEEAQIEELARLQEEAGGNTKIKRVEWMYSGAAAAGSGHGTTEELEGYLLGKRRVDPLLKKQDDLQKEKATTQDAVEADPLKDIAAKVALDPLLMIQKREKEAMEKQLEMEAKAEERKRRRDREREKDGRREERRYHSDRHRHHTSSSSRRHRSRSRSPKRDSRDYKQRDRSRSPRRDFHREYRSRDDYRSRDPRDSRRQESSKPSKPSSDDRAARLAAMQSDASSLENDRSSRLAAMAQRDQEEQAKEESKRNKGANFKASVYQQTENVSLASRLQGSRNMSTV
jgi:hypothetical protein